MRTANHGHMPYQKIVLKLGQGSAAQGPGLVANQTTKAARGKKSEGDTTVDDDGGTVPLNWRYSHEDKDSEQAQGLGPNASMTGLGPGLQSRKPHTYSAVLFLSASSLFVSKQSTGPSVYLSTPTPLYLKSSPIPNHNHKSPDHSPLTLSQPYSNLHPTPHQCCLRWTHTSSC